MAGLAGCLGSDADLADDTDGETEPTDDDDEGYYHVAQHGDDDDVGTASAPLSTIGEGLQRAQPGETIYVHPGEYFELGSDERPLTTVRPGEPDAPITFTGPANAIFRPSFHIIHDHFRLEGLTFEGLVDPDNRDDPESYYYEGGPIEIRPPFDTYEYVRDVVCAPHGVGFGSHSLIGLDRAKYVEIGPLKVTGLAGASWILDQVPDRHAGEIVYVGSPLELPFDWIGPLMEDYPWKDEIDETSHVHIHHIDNSEGHPHSNLVDAKDGTHDILVEYCTVAGGSQNTEPYNPEKEVSFASFNATLRWCDLRNGEGNAVRIAGPAGGPIWEVENLPFPPEMVGTKNAIYGNFMKGFDHHDINFDGSHASDQDILCGNGLSGLQIPSLTETCTGNVPQSDGIGHAEKPMPETTVQEVVELMFEFDRSPIESEINPNSRGRRPVSFMCYELVFLDNEKAPILAVDVGPDELDVIYADGVYEPVFHNGETSRFFGREDRRTTMYFRANQVRDAHYLEMRGWPVDDISAEIYFDGELVDHVELIGDMTRTRFH